MFIKSFRIKNFRSIVDTDWCDLSLDNITELIGQNESGKTSVLHALNSFEAEKITEDDLRSDESLPEISCSFSLGKEELERIFKDKILPNNLQNKLEQNNYRINLTRYWESKDVSKLRLEEINISELFNITQSEEQQTQAENSNEEAQAEENPKPITEEEFVAEVYKNIPSFLLFEDYGSLLPNTIDLEDLKNENEDIEGYWGAKNFLSIAELDLVKLSGSLREIKTKIGQTNETITKGFQEFWRQKIGKEKKIKIEFSLEHYDNSAGEKAGKPYLAFWISDGGDKLFPKQRSRGVRWFLSFYLELQASAKDSEEQNVIYLIDEPGSTLHVRAQEDVLKVFDSLKDKLQIIYATHSPFLLKTETVHRILAVQRSDEDDEKSETKILSPNQLGSASADTLSPLYTAMGADFSSQQVIKKKNNVILEEISAFYYLTAFKELIGSKKKCYFLPATGTSNVPQLTYLFLGWGLDFIVVLDDDSSGRQIYNELKKNLFQDDERKTRSKIIKIKDCDGIEDVFSQVDFKKIILKDEQQSYVGSNSQYMKRGRKSKAVAALKFMLEVKKSEIKLGDFEEDTQSKIKNVISLIDSKL